MELNKIFLGNTPSDQRNFLSDTLKFLREEKGFKRVFVPCCGQFAIAKMAINAGFKNKDIFTSDVSLFSSVVGYLYDHKPIDDIGFTITDEESRLEYEKLTDSVKKVAYLMFLMKLGQFRTEKFYEREYKKEMLLQKEAYLKNMEEKVKKNLSIYEGVSYEIRDLRDYFSQEMEYDKKDICVVNPPAYKKGYTKMFDFSPYIEYEMPVEEFDFKAEYKNLYYKSKEQFDIPFVWYRYAEAEEYPNEDLIFARMYTTVRYDYWLFTKPELLEGFDHVNYLKNKKPPKQEPKKFKIMPPDYEITPESTVKLKAIDQETALYYRDLWAHRLGTTGAEMYYLIFIDDLLTGTVGFHGDEIKRMNSDRILEVFCFNCPHDKYWNLNRLMMGLLTCSDMGKRLYKDISSVNRFQEINGLKTACLSKYRKVKLNNGLLDITKKEKLKNGMYKLMYETEWHERSYSDVVKWYLEEFEEKDAQRKKRIKKQKSK